MDDMRHPRLEITPGRRARGWALVLRTNSCPQWVGEYMGISMGSKMGYLLHGICNDIYIYKSNLMGYVKWLTYGLYVKGI